MGGFVSAKDPGYPGKSLAEIPLDLRSLVKVSLARSTWGTLVVDSIQEPWIVGGPFYGRRLPRSQGLVGWSFRVLGQLGPQHGANLAFKNKPKSMKIEKMMPSQENFNFWLIFDRFLASTSTPGTLKIIVFL